MDLICRCPCPDLGKLNGQPLQKIGINPVLGMPCGGPRRLVDGL